MDISLAPLLNFVIPILASILLVVAVWAAMKAAAYFKIKIDDSTRVLIETAIQNGIKFAISKAEGYSAKAKIHTDSPVVGAAANYVVAHVPEALTKMGVTQAQLTEKIIARLPQ